MYDNLAILAAFAFLFSAIAGRVERSVITGPTIYVLFGLLAGPVVFGIIELDVQAVEIRVIADLTLALVLFIDAANADLSLCPAQACHHPPPHVTDRPATGYSAGYWCGPGDFSRSRFL